MHTVSVQVPTKNKEHERYEGEATSQVVLSEINTYFALRT